MNARHFFAAAAIAVVTASEAACSGGSPTASSNLVGDAPRTPPTTEPTDTTGFVPPPMLP